MRQFLYNIRYTPLLTFVSMFFLVPLTSYAQGVFDDIGIALLEFIGLLTGYGGTLLNFAIDELIIGMGEQVNGVGNAGGYGFVINEMWRIIRDLMNIAFIFGLVYAGIQIILGLNVPQARRTITLIIVGALLVNFSLFFSKVVIEVANIAANEIYQTIEGDPRPVTGGVTYDPRISDRFMQAMGLLSIYDTNDNKLRSSALALQERGLAFFLAASIFLLIAAFVFAAGGILVIIRFIVLIFLMIFSPIAFGALAFPGLRKYAAQWWSLLFRQAFFAPAFLFLIYISLLSLSVLDDHTGRFDNFLIGDEFEVKVLLNFAIAAGLLIAAIIIAKNMGAIGAKTSIKIGNNLRGRAQRTVGRTVGSSTFGLGARAAQSTLGYGAYRMSQSGALKDRAANSWLARQQLKASRSLAGASFDARRVGGAGKALGVGEGKKGGYEARFKAAQKKEQEFTKSLGTVGDDDAMVQARKDKIEEHEANIRELKAQKEGQTGKERETTARKIQEEEKKLKEARQKLEQERNRRQLGDPAQQEAIKKAQAKVKQAKKDLGEAVAGFNEARENGVSGAILAEYQKSIDEFTKHKKEAEKELQETRATAGGYIDSIGQRGRIYSFFQGRDRYMNREASDTLRREWEKKTKKTKEEKRHDETIGTMKESGKKE